MPLSDRFIRHLLQLHTIGNYSGEAFGEIGAHRNGIPIGLVAEHLDHLSDQFVYIKRLQMWRTLSVKRADTVDDVGCTSSVLTISDAASRASATSG